MKKKIIALLLTASMLTPTIGAYTNEQVNTADALNNLELFLGNGVDYNLDGVLSRAEGVTLLVRMIGQEKTANKYDYSAPFTDVPTWASAYVNYAWLNKITNGTSDVTFGSDVRMDEYMFLTLTLRMLGYKDSGENPEFTWDKPYELAESVGLIDKNQIDSEFTRGDAIEVFWNALTLNDNALAEDLISRGVFTEEEFEAAVDVQKNGRTDNVGVPIIPTPDEDDEQSGGTLVELPEISDDKDDDKKPTIKPNPDSGKDDEDDEPTKPSNPTNPEDTDEPEDTSKPGTDGVKAPEDYTYEEYNAMTGDEQMAHLQRFESMEAFFAWYNAAKAEYEANQDYIEIPDDGVIDLEEILGEKGNN